MMKLFSTVAVLGLLAGPALADHRPGHAPPGPPNNPPGQSCNSTAAQNSRTNVSTLTSSSSEDFRYQGYSGKPPRSPDGQGTSGYTESTSVYSVDKVFGAPFNSSPQNCPSEHVGSYTINETSDVFGPGKSPAEQNLGVTEGSTCEATVEGLC